jgi:hypothetical protein
MQCPLCKATLNIKIEGFTCQESSGGPYLKGRVALMCSNTSSKIDAEKRCRYMHTTNFKTSSVATMEKLERVAGELIRKLPDFGPWEVFALSEKERKPRGAYRRGK